MRKALLILALASKVHLGFNIMAQDLPASPWKLEALTGEGDIKYDLKSGEMRATKGVRVTYKAGSPDETVLTSNSAVLNQKSGLINATGNVFLRRDSVVWAAERIEYNFRTKIIKAAQFSSSNLVSL